MSASRLVHRSHLEESGCLVWEGRPTPRYGRVMVNGLTSSAHRLSYECFVGAIPRGHHVHHMCGNRLCINPLHLEAVSPREHVLGRHPETIAPAIAAARRARREQQRAQTHCVHGHEFTPENTWVRREGWRQCRTCLRKRQRARRR